jgi:hypothetical protein
MATPTRPCPYCGQQVLVTAAHCGFCGRPLPTAQGAPGGPPAAGGPSKTIMGYALPPNFGQGPAPGQPGHPPPAGPPRPMSAPPGAAPHAPAPFAPAPQQPPPMAGGYGQPAGYPQQPQQMPPAQYGQQQPQYGQQPPAQPMGYPQQQPMAQPAAPAPGSGGGLAQWGANVPQSAPGTLFGIPFSTLKDQGFLNKLLGISAIALVATRFLPVSFSPFFFIWKFNTFGLLIFPIIAAAVYAGVALAPKHIQEKIPPVVLQWGPFLAAYLGVGITGAAGGGALGYLYPLLVFGMIVYLQDEDDMVARVFIALGAIGALSVSLGSLGGFFYFGGGVLRGIVGILSFIVLLGCAACLVFAIPTKWVPKLAMFKPFAPIVTAVLILWPFAQAILGFVANIGTPIMALLGTIHQLVLLVAFYAVLLMTAPAAFDVIKGWLRKAGVNTSTAAMVATAGGGGMTVEQRLAELDAAWQRGGMTPEEYQARRNQILAGG